MWFSPAHLNIPRADSLQAVSSLTRFSFVTIRAFTRLRRMPRCDAVEEAHRVSSAQSARAIWQRAKALPEGGQVSASFAD